jgi:hypothetical protein
MQPLNEQAAALSQANAMQGMSMVRRVEILPGQVLYRFYDSGRAPTPQLGANGPWWVEFEGFQSIKHFALRNGYSFSYAARLFAAILYEWSEVNAFVACATAGRLVAWKGRGKQVRSQGRDDRDLATMTPMQSVLEVYQLYIPGLGGPSSIARTALHLRSHGVL